jgi:hypothetical protein
MATETRTGKFTSTRGMGHLRVIAFMLTLFAGGIGASTFGPMLLREIGFASVAAQDASTPVATDQTAGANTCFVDSDGVQAKPWARSELFFGTTKPDGTIVTNDEWLQFLKDDVTPRFPDGLTVLTGLGQWRNSSGTIIQERSNVLIILYPLSTAQASSTKLEEIRDAYEQQFHQSSVLRADDGVPDCTSF